MHFSTRAQQSTRFSSNFCCTFLLTRNRARDFPASSVALFYSHATEHTIFQLLLLHFSTRAQQSTRFSSIFCCTILLARNRARDFSSLLLHFSTRAQQSTRFSSIFCCTILLARKENQSHNRFLLQINFPEEEEKVSIFAKKSHISPLNSLLQQITNIFADTLPIIRTEIQGRTSP